MGKTPKYKELDEVKRKIFNGIVTEFNSKFIRDISFDDILDVAEAQSITIHKAMENHKNVRIQNVGRIMVNKGQLEILRIAEKLVETEGIPLEQAKNLATNAVKAKFKELKETNKVLYRDVLKANRTGNNKCNIDIPLDININKI